MRQFSSNDFTYRQGKFIAEASDLQLPPGAAVREFEIRSAKTGAVVRFELAEVERDREGDVQYWIYMSEHLPIRQGRVTATIFND
jgi:hypothetical protein